MDIFHQSLVWLNPLFSVTQLLERIGEVVEQNHLFTSDGPTLGEELESLQQHLESLSSAQSPLETGFNTSHGLEIHTRTFFHTHTHSPTANMWPKPKSKGNCRGQSDSQNVCFNGPRVRDAISYSTMCVLNHAIWLSSLSDSRLYFRQRDKESDSLPAVPHPKSLSVQRHRQPASLVPRQPQRGLYFIPSSNSAHSSQDTASAFRLLSLTEVTASTLQCLLCFFDSRMGEC